MGVSWVAEFVYMLYTQKDGTKERMNRYTGLQVRHREM